MKIRYLFVALACALTSGLLATSASASNYCVGSVPACTASPVADFSFDRQGVLDAVTAANNHAGPDTIYIAEGTISLSSALQPSTPSGEPVEIIGAGVGRTIFNGTVSSSPQISWDFSDSTSSVSGFSLNVNGAVNGGSGMWLNYGTAKDVAITEGQTSNSGYLATSLLNGATLENSKITNASPGSNGVFAQFGSATLTNVTLDGADSGTGLYLNPSAAATFNLSRLKISTFDTAINVAAGNVNLNDSLIDIGNGTGDAGFYAYNAGSATVPIVARVNRVTIVGTGTNQRGMHFSGGSPSGHFDGEFKDLLIYGTGNNFSAQWCAGAPSAGNPSWTYNDVVATNGGLIAGAYCSIGYNTKIDLAATDPEFRDFSGLDYRLAWSSPLIDAGTSTGALDLFGNTRVVDGDGDGTAKADVGAIEYQRNAPIASVVAAKETLGLLESTTFTGTASDPESEGLTYSWEVNGSPAVGTSNTLAIGFIAAGQYVVKFKATDESGLTGSASVTVNVQNSPPPTVAAPTAKVTSKPKKSFKRGKTGFAVAKKGAPSFTVVFTDTAQAKITLHSIGKKKKLKKVKGETLFRVNSATTKFGFGGKFGGKRLKAGKYRVTITPMAASGATGKPVTTDFTLK